ncbi:MAG: hypothetical protein KAH32_07465, partial [Chlamydiia bacterium]|nr:hypothetical protein [Chlamydiia bacterium]
MGRFVDLTGKKFGRLFVLERDGKNKHNQNMWKCVCDCGAEVRVRGGSLTSGQTKSCGCLRLERLHEATFRDLTGLVFGRLTVIALAGKNKHKHTLWQCLCECGSKVVVEGQSLITGRTTSCGCYQKERLHTRNFKDLTGQRFGRLIVLSRAEDRGGNVYWKCLCDCGNTTVVQGGGLRNGQTKSCGCYQRDRMAELHSGSKSNFWKNGITPLQGKIRKSIKYKEWRTEVFERDNYVCRYSKRKGVLSCHHIKPFAQILEENNITTMEEALLCKELW